MKMQQQEQFNRSTVGVQVQQQEHNLFIYQARESSLVNKQGAAGAQQ